MNPQLEKRAGELFREASSLPPAQRGAFLQAHCADGQVYERVCLLLEHDEVVGEEFLRGGARDDESNPASSATPLERKAHPLQIGRFRILSVLGHGGMGTVYEAEQDKPQRRVALKVVRSGWMSKATLRRFEFEAEVLARLDHPGIARVYDAGTADSGDGPQPYFAMELVAGQRLDSYIREANPPIDQRLKLFLAICQAVHHAHTKGVVHRDLKPANILVTGNGQPKILDFGVARATDSDLQATTLHTESGQIIGTLPYMAPEQAAGRAHELDTSSDVYALGVIAFELLSGKLPYSLHGKALHDAVRVICEDEPSRLSSINRSLRGDVETIVGKALAKDKSLRYPTAGELADDVRRYLHYEPIAARPPGTWYQLSRFARRNKLLVGSAVIVLAALVGGTVVSTWQAIRATAERRRADEQAAIATAVSEFQSSMLASADPQKMLGDQVTVVQAITAAVKQLDAGKLKDQPLVEAAVRNVIGNTLYGLDRYEDAELNLRRALELSRNAYPAGHPIIAQCDHDLAKLLWNRGYHPEAEALLREALQIRRKALPAGHADIAKSLQALASFLISTSGNHDEAEPLAREALDICRKTLSPHDPQLGLAARTLAWVLRWKDKLIEAEPLFRESIATCSHSLPEGHPTMANAKSLLAQLLCDRGKFTEAEALAREALDINRGAYPAGHREIAVSKVLLANVLEPQGKLAEAETLMRTVLEYDKGTPGRLNVYIAYNMNYLGTLVRDQGRPVEAERIFREAVAIGRATMSAQDPGLAELLRDLAKLLNDAHRANEAEPLFREAVEIQRSVLEMRRSASPLREEQIADALDELATSLEDEGELAAGEPLLAELFAITSRKPSQMAAVRMGRWGHCLTKLGRWNVAEAPLRAAYERLKFSGREYHPCMREIVVALADVCNATGRHEEAEAWRERQAAIPPPATRSATTQTSAR